MIQSRHLYPIFSDLIEAQKKSVLSFLEKGILEEFELFSHVTGKHLFMVFHGSKFFLQKPFYSFEKILESQKTYSVSLFVPLEFQWRDVAGSGSVALPYEASNSGSAVYRVDQFVPSACLRLRHSERRMMRTYGFAETGHDEVGHGAGAGVAGVDRGLVDYVGEVDYIGEAGAGRNGSRNPFFVYFGEIPLMTERGHFLINGSSRVLVNQIVRCPNLYFKVRIDQKNRRTYIGSFLSEYGSWLRLETDYKNRIWVRIDKSQRFSIYALIRALGFPENFLKYQLKYYLFLYPSQEEYFPSTPHEAIQYIWKKCTPNRWNSLQGCYNFFYTKFFNPKKYSIGSVGRERLNKRFGWPVQRTTLAGNGEARLCHAMSSFASAADLLAPFQASHGKAKLRMAKPSTAKPSKAVHSLAKETTSNSRMNYSKLPTLSPEDIFMALDLLIQFHYGTGTLDDIDHLKNRRVRLPGELMQNQLRVALSRVHQSAIEKLSKITKETGKATVINSINSVSDKAELHSKSGLESTSSRSEQRQDFAETNQASLHSRSETWNNIVDADNSRPATSALPCEAGTKPTYGMAEPTSFAEDVGFVRQSHEAVAEVDRNGARHAGFRVDQFQFAPRTKRTTTGQSDGAVAGHNKGSYFPSDSPRASNFIQTQIFSATFRELFNTSQLSQYMDQTNPLAEITHKRRLSSLGPGGIAKDQAGVAVREIHPSHFGRICPIETPEGQNAGLVGSLATYCQLTSEGFLESAYLSVNQSALSASSRGLYHAAVASSSSLREQSEQRQGPTNRLRHVNNIVDAGSSRPATSALPCEAGTKPTYGSAEDRNGAYAMRSLNTAKSNKMGAPFSKIKEWFTFEAEVEDEAFISAEMDSAPSSRSEQADEADESSSLAEPHRAEPTYSMVEPTSLAEPQSPSRAEPTYGSVEDKNVVDYVGEVDYIGEAGVDRKKADEVKPTQKRYPVRYKQEFFRVSRPQVEYFGVSPIQMISLATSLIPFLEHDDANRALMGSNMQRQAVPLLSTERPFVGTGLELQAARDSTTLCLSEKSGQVNYLDAIKVSIQGMDHLRLPSRPVPVRSANQASPTNNDRAKPRLSALFGSGQSSFAMAGMAERGRAEPAISFAEPVRVANKGFVRQSHGAGVDKNEQRLDAGPCNASLSEYFFQKYWRSNQSTCICQTPQIQLGDWIEAGDLLADGAASSYGDIALGKNILVAYLPWEGYNFEDAIVINERLVNEDIYTSIHIDRYDVETRDTEYGKEQILRDLIHGVSGAAELNKPTYEQAPPCPVDVEGSHGVAGQRQPAESTTFPTFRSSPGFANEQADESSSLAGNGEAYAMRDYGGSAVYRVDRNEQQADFFDFDTRYLDERGIIYPGTWVEENDILVGKITPISPAKPTPEYRLLLAIFETKPLPFKESSLRVPIGIQGRVLECLVVTSERSLIGQTTESTTFRSSRSEQADESSSHGEADVAGLLLPRRSEPTYGMAGSALRGSAISFAEPVPVRQAAVAKRQGPTNKANKGFRVDQFTERTTTGRDEVGHGAGDGVSTIESVQVFIASKRKIQLGDKMSGRHGNKGIVSLILPSQDMPFLQDGTSVDIVLNPLGVPSRMNVGQVLECLFGLAAFYLQENYRLLPFDECNGSDASRGLVYKKLLEASYVTGYKWIFDPNHPGKMHIFDGRTGEHFDQPILVGYSYMLKLIHQVDEKMHARSTGPYSLITQQPLGGRSKQGGQRLGEMEVWALEGFGSSSILHEFLTLKSDDIDSRNTFLFYLMKRRSTSPVPPSFAEDSAVWPVTTLADSSPYSCLSASALAEPTATSAPFLSSAEPYVGSALPASTMFFAASAKPGFANVAKVRTGNRGFAGSMAGMQASLHSRSEKGPTLPSVAGSNTAWCRSTPASTVPESFRVLVHELQSLCLSVYFNPEFRLTYPSLLGWDGLFLLPSKPL